MVCNRNSIKRNNLCQNPWGLTTKHIYCKSKVTQAHPDSNTKCICSYTNNLRPLILRNFIFTLPYKHCKTKRGISKTHKNSFIRMDRLHNVKGRITNIFSHVKQKNPYVKYEIIYHNYLRELAKCIRKYLRIFSLMGICRCDGCRGFIETILDFYFFFVPRPPRIGWTWHMIFLSFSSDKQL